MKLGEVCQIKYGKDHKALLDGTIPVYGSGGIMRYCDKYIHNKQSVLIPRKGTLSNIFYVNQPFWTVDTLFWTDINEEIVLPKYLYYLLLTKNLSSLNVGTAVPSLTADILNDIQITLPSLSIQENIVKVLSSFDDKIELNKQLNDYLAEIRQLIVKMKISDIFNRDGDSCSLVPLKKVANIQSGYSYKSKELTDNSQIGMLTIKNFQRNGLFKLDGFKPINPEKAKESHYVTAGEIVVAHTDLTQNADIIGRAIQVIDNGGFDKILASCDLVKVSSTNESISNELLAALLATSDFYNHCLGYVNGTTVLHLGKKALHEYNLKIPNNTKLLQTLDCCFQSIAFYQSYLIQETRILKRSRDLLLTKLLSGDIDVLKSINE